MSPTISEAFEQHRTDWLAMKNQAKKTEESYHCTANLLVRFFGDVEISSIKFVDVKKWRDHLLTYQKPNSVRNNIVNLRSVLRYLANQGCTVLHYDTIPVPRRENKEVEFLDEQEMDEFIADVGRKARGYHEINRLRNVATVEMIYATGLRVSELCSLNKNSIKRDGSFTIIGKCDKRRIGFVNTRALQTLSDYYKVRTDNHPAMFVTYFKGEVNRLTPSTLRRVFESACSSSVYKNIHPHTIRHSYATRLLRKRVDLRFIAELMGHSSMDTTKIYTHVVNEDLREVYNNAIDP